MNTTYATRKSHVAEAYAPKTSRYEYEERSNAFGYVILFGLIALAVVIFAVVLPNLM